MSFPDAIEQRRRVAAYLKMFPAEREAVENASGFVWNLGCGIVEFHRVISEAVENGEPVSAGAWEELKAHARIQWPEDLLTGCHIGHRNGNPWKSDLLENGSVASKIWFLLKFLVVAACVVVVGSALKLLPASIAGPLMSRFDRLLAAALR